MLVGILKEIKTEEHRVAMTPAGVEVMKQHGHTVLVEKSAGIDSGFDDQQYIKCMLDAGASGYLIKEEVPEKLIDAVKGVARGEKGWVSKRVAEKLAKLN